MFNQVDGSAVPTTCTAAYRSERNATNIRGANADTHIYRTGTDASPRQWLHDLNGAIIFG